MDKIKITSRMLSLIFFTACIAHPFINLYAIIYYLPQGMQWTLLPADDFSHFSLIHHFIILVASYIPIACTVMIYFQLGQLFRLYEKKILFARENIDRIRCIGKYVLLKPLVFCFLYQPLMMYILTYLKPMGQHQIMLSFSTDDLNAVITGIVIVVASWIATEANKLNKDLQFTV